MMKLILTGSTGMIGKEVFSQCIHNQAITSIIVLTRRSFPSDYPSSPKVKVVLHDFTSYSPSLLEELSGAEACIWAIGVIPGRSWDLETAKKVNIDYPFEAAKAFISHLAPRLAQGKIFRFLYVSGFAVSRDPEKKYKLFQDAGRIKGEIERKLVQLEDENKDKFAAYIARPGSVIPPNRMLMSILGALTDPLYPAMKVEELAAAMIDTAIRGGEVQTIMHDDLKATGRALLHGGAAEN